MQPVQSGEENIMEFSFYIKTNALISLLHRLDETRYTKFLLFLMKENRLTKCSFLKDDIFLYMVKFSTQLNVI